MLYKCTIFVFLEARPYQMLVMLDTIGSKKIRWVYGSFGGTTIALDCSIRLQLAWWTCRFSFFCLSWDLCKISEHNLVVVAGWKSYLDPSNVLIRLFFGRSSDISLSGLVKVFTLKNLKKAKQIIIILKIGSCTWHCTNPYYMEGIYLMSMTNLDHMYWHGKIYILL